MMMFSTNVGIFHHGDNAGQECVYQNYQELNPVHRPYNHSGINQSIFYRYKISYKPIHIINATTPINTAFIISHNQSFHVLYSSSVISSFVIIHQKAYLILLFQSHLHFSFFLVAHCIPFQIQIHVP